MNTQDEELTAIKDAYAAAVRNLFDVFQNSLLRIDHNGIPDCRSEAQIEVDARNNLRTGLAFVRRARELAEITIRET